MTYDYDMIVIGAGGGGLTASIGAASIGASVLLIEGEKLGGDCTHYGCVPSKALIKAAATHHAAGHGAAFGLDNAQGPVDLAKVLSGVKAIVNDVEDRFEDIEHIRSLGVDVEMGFATFEDDHTVLVNGKAKTAKKIVIAAGARPAALPIPGLDKCKPKDNRTIFEPDNFTSLTIIGSGPIGSELGQAFTRLGVDVTIVTRDSEVLSREENRVGTIVRKSMEEDGVRVITNADITEAFMEGDQKVIRVTDRVSGDGATYSSDEILVAVGRQPNVEKLELEKAGVTYDGRHGIPVNPKTQTNVRHIYAVGDIATKWKFTHYANHMAKVTLAHAIFRLPTAQIEEDVIARATFTAPEIGSVGITYDALDEQEKKQYHVFDKDFGHVDRAITDRAENGFIRLIADRKGKIVGGTVVGPFAGELINEVALAMKNGVSITQLSDTIHAYPTYGYGLRNCADGFRAMGYTSNKKRIVKKIFGLRGRD